MAEVLFEEDSRRDYATKRVTKIALNIRPGTEAAAETVVATKVARVETKPRGKNPSFWFFDGAGGPPSATPEAFFEDKAAEEQDDDEEEEVVAVQEAAPACAVSAPPPVEQKAVVEEPPTLTVRLRATGWCLVSVDDRELERNGIVGGDAFGRGAAHRAQPAAKPKKRVKRGAKKEVETVEEALLPYDTASARRVFWSLDRGLLPREFAQHATSGSLKIRILEARGEDEVESTVVVARLQSRRAVDDPVDDDPTESLREAMEAGGFSSVPSPNAAREEHAQRQQRSLASYSAMDRSLDDHLDDIDDSPISLSTYAGIERAARLARRPNADAETAEEHEQATLSMARRIVEVTSRGKGVPPAADPDNLMSEDTE